MSGAPLAQASPRRVVTLAVRSRRFSAIEADLARTTLAFVNLAEGGPGAIDDVELYRFALRPMAASPSWARHADRILEALDRA
jgi:hypothetical protein